MAEGVKPKVGHESKRVTHTVDLFESKNVQNEGLTDFNPTSNVTKEDSHQDENIEMNYYEDVDVQSLAEERIRDEKLEDHYKIARKIDLNFIEYPLEEFANEDGMSQEEHYKTARKVGSDGNSKPKEVASDEDKEDGQFGKTLGTESDSVMEATHEEQTREEVNEPSCDQDIYSAVEAEVSSSPEEIEGDIYIEVKKECDPCQTWKTMPSFDNPWFWGEVERSKVEEVLNESLDQEGIFIVRESKRGGSDSPYAISVVHSREIFHVLVRKRDDGKMAVGKPKFREKKFATLPQLIEFYQNNDLILYDSQGDVLGVVQLGEFPEKDL